MKITFGNPTGEVTVDFVSIEINSPDTTHIQMLCLEGCYVMPCPSIYA